MSIAIMTGKRKDVDNLFRWLRDNGAGGNVVRESLRYVHIKEGGRVLEVTDGYKLAVAIIDQPISQVCGVELQDGFYEVEKVISGLVVLSEKTDSVGVGDWKTTYPDLVGTAREFYRKSLLKDGKKGNIFLGVKLLSGLLGKFDEIVVAESDKAVCIELLGGDYPQGTYLAVLMQKWGAGENYPSADWESYVREDEDEEEDDED